MSGLDQPLLIATTGYHVGHQRSIRIAEEQGYFQQEGLAEYVYDYRGLLPGPLEREGLALQMKEHGVDIACGANTDSVILQRVRGAELVIVGAWRYVTRPRVVSAKNIVRVEDLWGKKIGVRELGGLSDRFIAINLIRAGLNPSADVEWFLDPVFAYANTQDHANMLRSGKVDVITTNAGYAAELVNEGYHLLLDGAAGRLRRPGRVIVATRQTAEQRATELSAFLKANLRAFWFASDPDHFDAVYDLETRMRHDYTHNEHERTLRIFRDAPGFRESLMPLDGKVDRTEIQSIIDEMRDLGELTGPCDVDAVFRGDIMETAYDDLRSRSSLQPIIEKIGRETAAA